MRKHTTYQDAIELLCSYIEAEDFKGYDPYDALMGWTDFRLLGRMVPAIQVQIQKRNPVNLRPLLGIPKMHNAKAMGLFLHAWLLLDGRTTLAAPGRMQPDGHYLSVFPPTSALREPTAVISFLMAGFINIGGSKRVGYPSLGQSGKVSFCRHAFSGRYRIRHTRIYAYYQRTRIHALQNCFVRQRSLCSRICHAPKLPMGYASVIQ